MDETILTWNFPNWLTVLLMVILGFAAIGVVTKIVAKARAENA